MSRITMANVHYYLDMYNGTVDEIFQKSGVYFPRLMIRSAYGYRNIQVATSTEDIRCGLSTRECYEVLISMYNVVNIVRRGIDEAERVERMLVSEELGY